MRNIVHILPKHPTKKYRKRNVSNIKKVVIHHSATESVNPHVFAAYHVSKGWPGIGYHIVIFEQGRNRTNDYDTISYHTSKHNEDSIGICVGGDFTKQEVSERICHWLRLTLKELNHHFGPLEVGYHSMYKATECPGENLRKVIDHIIEETGMTVMEHREETWIDKLRNIFKSNKGLNCE